MDTIIMDFNMMKNNIGLSKILSESLVDAKIIITIYNECSKLIVLHSLNLETLPIIITHLMVIVSNYVKLSGIEKKELVIITINIAIECMPDSEEKNILKLGSSIIPNTIDLLVSVSKKRFIFKKYKKIFFCCN